MERFSHQIGRFDIPCEACLLSYDNSTSNVHVQVNANDPATKNDAAKKTNKSDEQALDKSVRPKVVSLQNGCICCTLREDLVEQVSEIAQSCEKFDYLVIESTGISEPAPVAMTFCHSLQELQELADPGAAEAEQGQEHDNNFQVNQGGEQDVVDGEAQRKLALRGLELQKVQSELFFSGRVYRMIELLSAERSSSDEEQEWQSGEETSLVKHVSQELKQSAYKQAQKQSCWS